MTKQEQAKVLVQALQTLRQEIVKHAQEQRLSNSSVAPITDGVADVAAYLDGPKVMWILKEPYDDVDSQGTSCGGGWDISSAFRNADAWANPTWKPIADRRLSS